MKKKSKLNALMRKLFINKKRKQRKEKEYDGDLFVLSGDEGSEHKDLLVSAYKERGKQWIKLAPFSNHIQYVVKVVGFNDFRANIRSWGRKNPWTKEKIAKKK